MIGVGSPLLVQPFPPGRCVGGIQNTGRSLGPVHERVDTREPLTPEADPDGLGVLDVTPRYRRIPGQEIYMTGHQIENILPMHDLAMTGERYFDMVQDLPLRTAFRIPPGPGYCMIHVDKVDAERVYPQKGVTRQTRPRRRHRPLSSLPLALLVLLHVPIPIVLTSPSANMYIKLANLSMGNRGEPSAL